MSVASNLNASPIISSREILKCILTYVVFSGVSKLSTRGGQQIILSDSLLDHLPSRFCCVGATPFSILLIVTSSLGILRANHRLSTTCHEFREVLLPAIYGNVHFSKGLDFKRLTTSFLDLARYMDITATNCPFPFHAEAQSMRYSNNNSITLSTLKSSIFNFQSRVTPKHVTTGSRENYTEKKQKV